jgi:hypothetical protein
MSQTLSVTEVARYFARYISRVAYRGECFVHMRENKPMAELRPRPVRKRLEELPARLASLPPLSETEATQFAADLTAAPEGLARAEVHDPWWS